jgi:hypothetical protein
MQNKAKSSQTFTNPGNLKKAKQLTFTPGLKQVERFLKGDGKVSMSTKQMPTESQAKTTVWLLGY